MDHDQGNYAKHACFWDWSGHDRTAEHAYWLNFAEKYGKKILIPMCALAETGAYMAERGFAVTAFDLSPEMIAEGNKRFGNVEGLSLCVGDVVDFRFMIPPVDFCYSMDFGHLLTLADVRKAFACINGHLRDGGALVIETNLRTAADRTSSPPMETFFPVKHVYPDIRVWKTGCTRSDAETGRRYISQTFHIEDEQGKHESFDHSFALQGYYREEWLAVFDECGFEVIHEYDSREVASWQSGGGGFCIFEAVKRAGVPKGA